MFSYKFYPNTKNFTPSPMVWMVTFFKSGNTAPQLLWFGIDSVLKLMNEGLTELIHKIINQLIIYGFYRTGAYRTAPATPGLLNTWCSRGCSTNSFGIK